MKKVWKWILLALSIACALCAFAACKKANDGTSPSHRHTFAVYAERQATCSKKGRKEHLVCMWCGKTFSNEETPREVSAEELEIECLPHTVVDDEAVEATCTKNGITAGKHCSVCYTVIEKQEVIPAGHREVVDKAVEATCTEDGKTEGKHCSACNTVIVKQEAIPATGHTEVIDEAIASTCIKRGKTEGKHCSVCNTVLVEQQEIFEMGRHMWNADNVCSVCGVDYYTEGLKYTINDDGNSYSVSDNGTASGDIVIPYVYEGKPVTAIKRNAFAHSGITGITIPSSVTSIGNWAFAYCRFTSVVIPKSVEKIEEGAFMYCTSESITVESGNTFYYVEKNCLIETATKTLIWGAYRNCEIPADVTRIGDGAFYLSLFTEFRLPNGLKSIGDEAFDYCHNVFDISIPSGVTKIGENAFYGCSWSLTSITVENGNTVYRSENNCLIETATNTLILGCGNSEIPAGVTSIGKYAFYFCGITSVTIPNSVTSIGNYAFYDCYALTSITISSSVTNIGHGICRETSKLSNLTVESGNPKYYSVGNCVIEKATSTIILGCKDSVIPADGSVTSIGDSAFLGCSQLTSITIPNGVTSIESYAFYHCYALTSIKISNSVTLIGHDIISNCRQLESIEFLGTKAEWIAITKIEGWNINTDDFTVHCSDGKLDKDGNEI